MNCCECGHEIPSMKHAWQKVIGWERQRSAGGTNAISLREPQQVFLCNRCMNRKKSGIAPGQQSLM